MFTYQLAKNSFDTWSPSFTLGEEVASLASYSTAKKNKAQLDYEKLRFLPSFLENQENHQFQVVLDLPRPKRTDRGICIMSILNI